MKIAFFTGIILLALAWQGNKPGVDITGSWAQTDTANVAFIIEKEYFYYWEDDVRFRYKTQGDSLFIYYDGWILNGTFQKPDSNTLIIDYGGETVYHKR